MSIGIYTARSPFQGPTPSAGTPAAEQIALPPPQPDVFFGVSRPPIPHSGSIESGDLDADEVTRQEELEGMVESLRLQLAVLSEIAYEAIGAAGWLSVPTRILDKIRVMAKLNPLVKVLPTDPPERNRGRQIFVDAVAKLKEAVAPGDDSTDLFAKKRERLSEWLERLQLEG